MKTCSSDQTTVNQSKDVPLDQNNGILKMTVLELCGNLNENEFQEIQVFKADCVQILKENNFVNVLSSFILGHYNKWHLLLMQQFKESLYIM